MRYQISGKQIDIGEALQTHVRTELGETVDKYGGRPTEANVVFSKSGHEYVCETVVHLSTGLNVSAKGHATDIYAAFDSSSEKMDKQLRRYKRRLKDHHKERSQPVELSDAGSYILAPSDESGEAEQDSVSAMIIAEMESKIPSLSVGEAVMQMELANAPVLVFTNENTAVLMLSIDAMTEILAGSTPKHRADRRLGSKIMDLGSILKSDAVKVIGACTSKKRLFHDLGELAQSSYGLLASDVIEALIDRESLGPTGVGHGIALPHARMDEVDQVCGLFLKLDRAIDFDAVDRQPVDLVFCLLAPKNAGVEHLKALALVSRTMRDPGIQAKLRANPDADTLHTILTATQATQAA